MTGTVLSGGQERLEQGATATGTIVSSGGALSGVYGGTAVDATVGSGGTLALYGDVYDAFASATNTTILPGGSLDVDYFAFVSGGTSYSSRRVTSSPFRRAAPPIARAWPATTAPTISSLRPTLMAAPSSPWRPSRATAPAR